MRLIFYYLLMSGFAAHIVGLGVYFHFQSTGASLYRYLSKGIEYLDHDSSRSRHLARFTRFVMLDSGLVSDPSQTWPRDIDFALPPWLGAGASVLRQDTAPRYLSDGQPVSSSDRNRWLISHRPKFKVIKVASVVALKAALQVVEPGTIIELQPGYYRLDSVLRLEIDGSADAPIVIRGRDIGSTILELEGHSGLVVRGGFWTVSDLIVRGDCANKSCPWLFRVESTGDRFTARNIFASGIEQLVKSGFEGLPPLPGLIEGITLVGGHSAGAALDWPEYSVRRIFASYRPGEMVTLCTPEETRQRCDSYDLTDAIRKVSEGGLILVRSGIYRQAATITKPDIHLLAEPGALLYRKSVQGKGALVTRANIVIEGLSCSHIKVADGNGCCVRQEKGDVTLKGVHFHHAQMGILTGHQGGNIKIFDSYFHDNGYDEDGNLGHNLYVNSGVLNFIRSWSLSARNAGHELKSRATVTVIRDSVIASLNARDSRLIDLPNGGVFILTGSILGEGPVSENWDLIGYGLEINQRDVRAAKENNVTIRKNTFYVDREQGGKLLHARHASEIKFRDNVIIGGHDSPSGNTYFDSRSDAGIGSYPVMKSLVF